MRQNITYFNILVVLLTFTCVLFGCGNSSEHNSSDSWNFNDNDIVRADPVIPDSIRIDIYVDATLSMQGFVTPNHSRYVRFIDELRTTAGVAWRGVDERYFKFGTIIREINLDEFRRFNTRQFYHERGIFERTKIDSVINRTDKSRVSIVITDLFQDEGDIHAIEEQIMQRCFNQGIQVAILGVESEFNGQIFDLAPNTPPYFYRSSEGDISTFRPFYALMFGDPDNIEHLFNNLNSVLPFVDENKFLVFSSFLMDDLEVSVSKNRECRSINTRRARDRYKNHFKFDLRDGYETGELEFDIKYKRNLKTPDFNEDRIELAASRKVTGKRDDYSVCATQTRDIEIIQGSLNRANNHLTGKLKLSLQDEEDTYSYQVYLKCSRLNGLKVPEWVEEFSSSNPSASENSNKTRNLNSFVRALIRANLTINQPKIAKFYITVRKM